MDNKIGINLISQLKRNGKKKYIYIKIIKRWLPSSDQLIVICFYDIILLQA